VLANLTGQAGQNQFRNFGSTMDLDVSKTPEQIQINKITGKLTQAEMTAALLTLPANTIPRVNRRN